MKISKYESMIATGTGYRFQCQECTNKYEHKIEGEYDNMYLCREHLVELFTELQSYFIINGMTVNESN